MTWYVLHTSISTRIKPTAEEIKQIEDLGDFKIIPESFVRTSPAQEGLNLEDKASFCKLLNIMQYYHSYTFISRNGIV